jgi:beta-glucosidase
MDVKQWGSEAFTDRLWKAYAEGKLPKERLSEMVRRNLRSVYAVGIDKWGPAPAVDMAKHNEIALEIARQGIVLLKNDGALPLAPDKSLKVAVIGGHAQEGVPSGTGSGAVLPVGGFAGVIKIGGPGTIGAARNLYSRPQGQRRRHRDCLFHRDQHRPA